MSYLNTTYIEHWMYYINMNWYKQQLFFQVVCVTIRRISRLQEEKKIPQL